jgi:hypothetical protein
VTEVIHLAHRSKLNAAGANSLPAAGIIFLYGFPLGPCSTPLGEPLRAVSAGAYCCMRRHLATPDRDEQSGFFSDAHGVTNAHWESNANSYANSHAYCHAYGGGGSIAIPVYR